MIVEVPKTAGSAFKMNADIAIEFLAILENGARIRAVIALECRQVGAYDLNLQKRDHAVSEELLADIGFGFGPRRTRGAALLFRGQDWEH